MQDREDSGRNCSLLLINEAHWYSVLGSSELALEGGRETAFTDRAMEADVSR
jgi:hypothetical protein